MSFKQINSDFLVEETPPKIIIPSDIDVVFVSDLFADDHLGGAELTTEALIEKSDLNVFKVHSKLVNLDLISQGTEKHWVFGNFFNMDLNLIPTIAANLNYSIIEYDYKYCKYRSPEKHQVAENAPCDCHNDMQGKMVSSFYYAADSLWWMSEKQRDVYHNYFPFLKKKKNVVLSSMFSDRFFEKINSLNNERKEKNGKWIIVGSTSWIKGVDEAKNYCEKNQLDYEVVWGLTHEELLEKFSDSTGHVFMPLGGDTCPRTVIEAKLLGCELILNENVQHAQEDWFTSSDLEEIKKYLAKRPNVFWKEINSLINAQPTISGYTTTLNCIEQDYPYVESIVSMLGFCDQVIVLDGGSTDGTWEKIEELSLEHDKLVIHQRKRDWNHPRFAVFDGLQKALARSMCTGDFCWQQDSDEVVHETHYDMVKTMVRQCPKSMNLVALPVIEYWGGFEKVRMDVNPWKWRLSRNREHITHGIPSHLRRVDEEGNLYALPGTDGCDYIDNETFEIIPCANFYDEKIHKVRLNSLIGDVQSQENYENWFNNVVNNLPGVYHFSWFNIERKIKTYKNYWSKHWQSLYNIEQEDTAENNMFFNKKWSKVSDKEIKKMSIKLSKEMGGWIFHEKVDFNKPTPSLVCELNYPSVMKDWVERNEVK